MEGTLSASNREAVRCVNSLGPCGGPRQKGHRSGTFGGGLDDNGKESSQPAKENAVHYNQGWLEGWNQHAEDHGTPDHVNPPSPGRRGEESLNPRVKTPLGKLAFWTEGHHHYPETSKDSTGQILESYRFNGRLALSRYGKQGEALTSWVKHQAACGPHLRLFSLPCERAWSPLWWARREWPTCYEWCSRYQSTWSKQMQPRLPPRRSPHLWVRKGRVSSAPVGPNFTNYDLTIFLKAKCPFSQGRKVQKMQHAST